MRKEETILVIDSWNLAMGITAELQHGLEGLASGWILESASSGKSWRLHDRILFQHVMDRQKKFANETTTLIHSGFVSVEAMLTSEGNILDHEKEQIFQYRLLPMGAHQKPVAGEILIVRIPD